MLVFLPLFIAPVSKYQPSVSHHIHFLATPSPSIPYVFDLSIYWTINISSDKMSSIIVLALHTLLLPFVNSSPSLPAISCTPNSMNQTQTVTSAVVINTNPATPFEAVKLSAINQTAWESYRFEGVSNNGTAGVSVNFYRSPSPSACGYGAVWVEINAVWSDSTQFTSTQWQNQSVIIDCDVDINAVTYGYWEDVLDTTARFTFQVPHTLAWANMTLFGDGIDGSWQMNSIAPPMTANATGQFNPQGSVELAPLTYWNEAIPVATLNTTIQFPGRVFDIEGFGGHWRNWASYDWNSLALDWYRVRAVAGPYIMIFWVYTSAIDGQIYTSGILVQNGTRVFASRNGSPTPGSDSAIFWLSYSGNVHGSYEDNSTGITVQFTGGREWRFFFTHTNVLSESPYGKKYSSFVNTAIGGDIEGPQFAGVATSDQAVIPNPVPI